MSNNLFFPYEAILTIRRSFFYQYLRIFIKFTCFFIICGLELVQLAGHDEINFI
jgi:hypothetical protein